MITGLHAAVTQEVFGIELAFEVPCCRKEMLVLSGPAGWLKDNLLPSLPQKCACSLCSLSSAWLRPSYHRPIGRIDRSPASRRKRRRMMRLRMHRKCRSMPSDPEARLQRPSIPSLGSEGTGMGMTGCETTSREMTLCRRARRHRRVHAQQTYRAWGRQRPHGQVQRRAPLLRDDRG